MLISSTTACNYSDLREMQQHYVWGDFMHHELSSALELDAVKHAYHMLHVPLMLDKNPTSCAVETTVLCTLNTCCDPATSAHAQRLVGLAAATAVRLQLRQDEIFQLRLAALLHDIGKVGIPTAILHKPGPLDASEWHIMRLHPQIGQYILLMAGGIFKRLAPMVVAHHEHWNGGGYPVGLRGEDIPLLARILAVVDSYDAMLSCRTYYDSDRPLSMIEACRELQRCAGQQYDPHVVAAFLAARDVQNVCTPAGTSLSPAVSTGQE